MLIQFLTQNYLSYRDKTILNMVATNDASHPTHTTTVGQNKTKQILRAAAIYGANGSGKSNIIRAMRFAQKLILEGTPTSYGIPITPFKLDTTTQQPTRFQFDFYHQGNTYTYGFRLNTTRVEQEFLYANPKGREVTLFERSLNTDGEYDYELGNTLTKTGAKSTQFLEYKVSETRPNQLFLNAILSGYLKEYPQELQSVNDWFRNVLTLHDSEEETQGLIEYLHANNELKNFAQTLLHTAGTGIQKITIEENQPQNEQNLFHLQLRESPAYPAYRTQSNIAGRLKIKFQHVSEQNTQPFELHEESVGTKRLLSLAPKLYDIYQGCEKVVIIDQLDDKLHTHLSKLLIESTLECPGNNQLIFTTHDTNLLNLDILRRDEIWFVEKDSTGSSHVYSLAEFKIRPDLHIQKGYHNGRFGAIPQFGDTTKLCSKPTIDNQIGTPAVA